jgi:hypothetical protein
LIKRVPFNPSILGFRNSGVTEARNEGGSQTVSFHHKAVVKDSSIGEAKRVGITSSPPNTCGKSVGDR